MKPNTCSMTPSDAEEGYFGTPLVGFEAGVGAGISLAVGKACTRSLSGPQLRTALTQITIGLLEHDFLNLCL
jgi:hypothetical protein